MFDVFLIGVAGILQLILTIYTVVISVRENRTRNAAVVGVIGFLAVLVTAWAGYDAYMSQDALIKQVGQIKKELSGAKVGLAIITTDPPVRELSTDKPLLVGMAFRVSEGVAKEMRCHLGAFTIAGPENPEQNRQAQSKFMQMIASEGPTTGEDRLPDTYCWKGLSVPLSEADIQELIASTPEAANRIVYAMGHVEWKNESGANFHTDVCKWMEPPKTRTLSTPGWHDCSF